MLIESRVGLGQPRIGHVLKAVANAEVTKPYQYSGMTGELYGMAEVAGKLVLGENGRRNSQFDSQGRTATGQYHYGTDAADRRVSVLILETPQRKIGRGLRTPLSGEIETEIQRQPQHEFGLAKLVGARTGSEAKAYAGSRRSRGASLRQAGDQRECEEKRPPKRDQGVHSPDCSGEYGLRVIGLPIHRKPGSPSAGHCGPVTYSGPASNGVRALLQVADFRPLITTGAVVGSSRVFLRRSPAQYCPILARG